MKYTFLLYIFLLAYGIYPSHAQEQQTIDNQLKLLFNERNYDAIIDGFTKDAQQLSMPSLYYLIFANNEKKNYPASLQLIELALQKDTLLAQSYLIKGNTLVAMGKLEEAIPAYTNALAADPDNFDIQYELASSYIKMGNLREAVAIYKSVLTKNEPNSNVYFKACQMIGLLESRMGNYKEAIPYFESILKYNADDYKMLSKLIQAYYAMADYKNAKPLIQKMYEAQANGRLENTAMEDMFCIEEFTIDGHKVRVFERYQDGPSERIYNKHYFYLLDANDKPRFRVQTEYAPVTLDGKVRYYLCVSYPDNSRGNSGVTLGKDYEYKTLKDEAVKYMNRLLTKQ